MQIGLIDSPFKILGRSWSDKERRTYTIADFFNYHCKFCSVAISLLTSKAFLTSDHDHYFWEGLHKDAKCSIL